MFWTLILNCLIILFCRVFDVSLGILRTVAVVQGRQWKAFFLGFLEVLLWVVVVSKFIGDLHHPAYAIAYSLGFGFGNLLGLKIEMFFASGDQIVRIFSREGDVLAADLRKDGVVVTTFDGMGKDGPIQLLFIQSCRRNVPRIIALAKEFDEHCFYTVQDVRQTAFEARAQTILGHRRIVAQKK